MILFVIAALLAIVVVRSYTTVAIPGWTSYVTGLLMIILIQSILISFDSDVEPSKREQASVLMTRTTNCKYECHLAGISSGR